MAQYYVTWEERVLRGTHIEAKNAAEAIKKGKRVAEQAGGQLVEPIEDSDFHAERSDVYA